MPTVELLTAAFEPDTNAWLQQTLSQFSLMSHIKTKNIQFDWEHIWRELVNIGIYRRGPDLAEVGTSWIESLVEMNAIRPISKKEVDAIGGTASFVSSAWKSTSIGNDHQVWGIPFRADVRVIFYWKDIVEKAGLVPESDFSSSEALHRTIKTLKSSIQYPWATSTDIGNHNLVYNAASWVWARGGDFISKDGKSITFTCPEAIAGLTDFFSLRQFTPSGAELTDAKVLEMFARKEIAAFIGGPWTLTYLQNHPSAQALMPLLGISLPPGPPFVGGSVLVVWDHTRLAQEALELVRFLCTPNIQTQLSSRTGLLPVRIESWAETMPQSQHYQILNNALTLGRPMPMVRLWGMIEEKLTKAFIQVQTTLDENPGADVEKTLRLYLTPLADRLTDVMLG
jgi:multiple sugar transport system substrate-binding protein